MRKRHRHHFGRGGIPSAEPRPNAARAVCAHGGSVRGHAVVGSERRRGVRRVAGAIERIAIILCHDCALRLCTLVQFEIV